MIHELYEVFKHPAPLGGLEWAVQFSNGIMCYRTKRRAMEVSRSFKAEAYQSVYNMMHSAADYLLWMVEGQERWDARDLLRKQMVVLADKADEEGIHIDTQVGWKYGRKWYKLVTEKVREKALANGEAWVGTIGEA